MQRPRTETGIDGGSTVVLFRSVSEMNVAGLEEHVVIWAGDVDLAVLQWFAIVWMFRRQGTGAGQNFGKEAPAMQTISDVQDHAHRRRQIRGQAGGKAM